MGDLDHTFSKAFLRPGTPEVILKPEQQPAIVKFVCDRLLTGFGSTFAARWFVFAIPLVAIVTDTWAHVHVTYACDLNVGGARLSGDIDLHSDGFSYTVF